MTTIITIAAFFSIALLVMALLMAIETGKENVKLRHELDRLHEHAAALENENNFYRKENKRLHQVLSMQSNAKPSCIDNNEGD